MFRRRHKLHPLDWARNMVWPRIGWRRAYHYWMARMGRLPGTENSLAIGFASGAAMSFTPFVGFHIILAAFLRLIFRGNIIASAIGTIIGNPWTFPFIWIWLYNVGIWLGFERPAPGLERVIVSVSSSSYLPSSIIARGIVVLVAPAAIVAVASSRV